ncbi:MAG: ribosome silencing factor [Candidatus Glassbacteria bacterium]|nr:ribosome silencing factor [Candidatus Glassbacteria bacterium]
MARPGRPSRRRDSRKAVEEQVFFAGASSLEKKADDVVVLDLRKVSDVSDFFLIAGGYTDIHVRAVAEHLIESLKKKYGINPWHVEGLENGSWVLLDYVDFVAHIFDTKARDFYQLERLWADAKSHRIADEMAAPSPD